MKHRQNQQSIKAVFAKSRYVVMKSTRDPSVVAHGNDLGSVLEKADKAGAREPFVVFPRDPAKRYIY